MTSTERPDRRRAPVRAAREIRSKPPSKLAEDIRSFSERLIAIQAPIRILEAVRWTDEVRARFERDGGRELPAVDRAWYRDRPLGFEAREVRHALIGLGRHVRRALGTDHPAGSILLRMCHEYAQVTHMLEQRGAAEFVALSRELYGSTADSLHPGEPSLAQLGQTIGASLDRIEPAMRSHDPQDVADIPGADAAPVLQANLAKSMGIHGSHPTVVEDDDIAADAAAGARVIKLRHDARFSLRELRVLEVHEGWVHVGTTLNGHAQPVCRFLSKGTPSTTITQEGLAVLMEILALASSPARQRRINNRVLALQMAEDGADFLEVYRFFLDQGFGMSDSYEFAARVFRGSTPDGGPFMKDIAYTKGFVLLYNFMRAALTEGKLDLIPLIFAGKTVLEDVGRLRGLQRQKLVEPPVFVPPPFADLHGLAAWMCYDVALSGVGSTALEGTYAGLLADADSG